MPSARNSGPSGVTPDTVWVDAGSDPAAAARLSSELGISMPVAGILSGRGITDPAEAAAFLNPRLACMGDPCLLHGARDAAKLLMDAVVKRSRICVFGDYDADGLTATALMAQVLRALGGDVGTFLPVRHADGYGLTTGALERCLAECSPDLLVTVDCGISAVDVVGKAVAVRPSAS